MAGSKQEARAAPAQPGPAGQGAGVTPAAFTLVHSVIGKKSTLFPPTRLMNPVTYIGRTPGNDIILESDNVSRRHAKLVVGDTGITVHDLDSHNGIFLNGKKVRSTPVNVGDLLYVADICIELKKSPDADQFAHQPSRIASHDEITGEEDPAVRSLATLLRATELISGDDDEAWPVQAIELCRELTEATVAVLVAVDSDGALETPVVLQPENNRKGEVPVLWPIVKKALDEGTAQFSADMRREPISKDESVVKSDVGAVMCVPVLVDGQSDGAVYLARPSPGQVFTERELEAVSAVTQLFALRRRRSQKAAYDFEPHGDIVTARAKAEAAEEKLREAQSDVRSLTERIHGLEADALKLRQQIDIEKQNAVEAKREADRGRAEAHKLEQGLHKTDEDVKKLKDALVRSEEERQRLKETLKERNAELDKLRDAVKQSEADQEQLRSEIADHVRRGQAGDDDLKARLDQLEQERAAHEATKKEADEMRDGFEKAVAEQAATVESLKQAMRATAPPMLADHVEGAAVEGKPLVTDVATGTIAALYITLHGFDAWAQSAEPAAVKKRLDHFCNSVALRAKANGGRVQQVLGSAHLVVFPADAASVRAAVRCGLEIESLVPVEDGVGVGCALHVGGSSSGFFGEGDSATLVEAGEALSVARGVGALAHEPLFYATQAVQKLVTGDPTFAFAIAGPAALVGGPTVLLFRVSSAEGAGGGAA